MRIQRGVLALMAQDDHIAIALLHPGEFHRAVGRGFDARTEAYVDMFAAGVIDPTKVARSALQNAASIAGLLLTTESLIVDKPISGEKVLVSEGMM